MPAMHLASVWGKVTFLESIDIHLRVSGPAFSCCFAFRTFMVAEHLGFSPCCPDVGRAVLAIAGKEGFAAKDFFAGAHTYNTKATGLVLGRRSCFPDMNLNCTVVV